MDWVGNSNSIYKTLGSSNHTDKEREENDFYATDPYAIDVLIKDAGITLSENVWECACGEGHLSERLKKYGYNVYSSDLIDRGYGDAGVDFLASNNTCYGDILTNPPYKFAIEFVNKALEIVDNGRQVIMFLKIQFLEGKARKKMFKENPPKFIFVSSSRIMCAKNAKFEEMKSGGGSAVAYAWYVWEKGFKGDTTLKWVN